ncbi:MAG: pyridoxamine 5'-phosphate oxidase family protein [Pseudomonadota bacterium]|nr:pyridoxamine 5'-phosphate oxidase family protein [Pseudomonadota bacterium]
MKNTETNLREEVIDFRNSFKTVVLATVSSGGAPDASYTPFTMDDNGNILIFISELAQHTQNLIDSPTISLLWIKDEERSRNLFARQRLTLQCDARELLRDTAQWDAALSRLQDVHGKTIEVLRALPDFHLFTLEARRGNYVRGFAKAFTAQGDELRSWLT